MFLVVIYHATWELNVPTLQQRFHALLRVSLDNSVVEIQHDKKMLLVFAFVGYHFGVSVRLAVKEYGIKKAVLTK